MGCASSKQKRCKHCQTPYSPVPRSYSMHVVHPPQQKGDSYHVVALTSTTLGTLALDSANQNQNGTVDVAVKGDDQRKNVSDFDESNGFVKDSKELNSKEEFSMGLIEAKTCALFSFDVSRDPRSIPDSPKMNLQPNGTLSPDNNTPGWLQVADEDANSKCPEFDPAEVSPTHSFYIKPIDSEKRPHFARDDSSLLVNDVVKVNFVAKDCERSKDKLVVYFTSLRGVRKTYEACCHVRLILKSLGVRVDERDVSMHSGFKEELRELMGEGFSGGGLPRVFIGRKYVGGAEEIRRMHEERQLEKLVEGCEMLGDGGGGGVGEACETCGDIRFVPCETCSGSCKIYYEGDDEEQEELEEGEETGEYGFQRCPDCNENGLIRCPICCD
ncbi:hypothetical protein D5086_008744 [Populus alba]|uniref:Uncharacterized protein n=1 Tax=Populus alba TaxID=43335 RepID=A0ACC4CGQ5_POPAL